MDRDNEKLSAKNAQGSGETLEGTQDSTERGRTLFVNADDLKRPSKRRETGRARKALYALCALVLLSGAVWGVGKLAKPVIENLQRSFNNVLLTDRNVEDVRQVKIAMKDGQTLTITREGDVYSVAEIAPQVLSQANCNSAFINAAQLLAEKVAAKDATDFQGFGLAPPASTVTIAFHDGTDFVLEIGDKAPTSNFYYAREAGSDTVYLMKGLLVNMYAGGVGAFRDLASFHIDTDLAVGFALETKGKAPMVFSYSPKPAGFRFSQWQMDEPYIADIDTNAAEQFLAAMSELKLTSYVDTTQDMDKYGLTEPNRAIRLYNEGGGEFFMAVGGRDGGGNAYVRFDEGEDVYLVSSSAIAFLDRASAASMISQFSNIHSITGLTELAVQIDGVETRYTVDRAQAEPVYKKEGRAMDAEAFKEAFQSVNTLIVADLIAQDAVASDAPVVLKLTYVFDNGDTGVVEYVDCNINDYAVRKNGTVGVVVRKDAAEPMFAMWRALQM